ncbi:hypothetical protein NEOLI_000517 [Neolecta irregularis DAH-3]|uniref:Uncharacterized protein n=1 Tax=Neolecta irregularis (strain DAH-3) TaxID=1198029 RepID=A0A1U7LSC7_NEOID|nr:hypothetical protein NEOLI_000517 [Neolecta irregularis DAH-3]|eukprot:OLL25421.1 hypothetical protein NEOLI_000517 [Neolecta irregularis DAH-3]
MHRKDLELALKIIRKVFSDTEVEISAQDAASLINCLYISAMKEKIIISGPRSLKYLYGKILRRVFACQCVQSHARMLGVARRLRFH